jgi:hypothetical protein
MEGKLEYSSNTVFRRVHGCHYVAVHVSGNGGYQCGAEYPFLGGVAVWVGHWVCCVAAVLVFRAAADPESYEEIGNMTAKRKNIRENI